MTSDAITLAGVQFGWATGADPVLDIDSFAVARGERVFIQGPSGSGKTTLLNLLGGVTQANRGRVDVLGTDMAGLSGSQRDSFRADHIGFIFQLFNLVPYLDLIQNVTLPCQFSNTRRNRAVDRSGSPESDAERLLTQMGLSTAMADRSVTRLSVGQQQRVAVARALIGAPDLIIADEPTSAIDAAATGAFLDLLFDEIDGTDTTLLFVSHDPALQPHFGRTVALADINRAAH